MGLFNLIFTLGVNRGPLEQGLNSASSHVDNFVQRIKGALVDAFSPGRVIDFVRQIAETTGRIKDLSEQTGISTDEIQRADHALKQSGLQFEELVNVIGRLGQARRDAVEGNEELRKTFERYGLTVKELNDPQKSNYELLMLLAAAFEEANLTAADQVAIMDLLGARAGKLANILGELHAQGPLEIFSREQIDQIDQISKRLEELARRLYVKAAKKGGWFTDVFDIFTRSIGDSKAKDPGIGELFGDVIAHIAPKLFGAVFPAGGGVAQPGLFKENAKVKSVTPRVLGASRGIELQRSRDALLAVGNFLGSDRSVQLTRHLESIGSRLAKIEANTKRVADGAVVIRK